MNTSKGYGNREVQRPCKHMCIRKTRMKHEGRMKTEQDGEYPLVASRLLTLPGVRVEVTRGQMFVLVFLFCLFYSGRVKIHF